MYKVTTTTFEYEEREKLSESEAYAYRWEIKMKSLCILFMTINSMLYTILVLSSAGYSDKMAYFCIYFGFYCSYLVVAHIGAWAISKVFDDNIQG